MAVKTSGTITLARVDDGADGNDGQMLYATSSTAGSTAAKVAMVSSGTLTLTTGATVAVRFTYANTAANPTLNINSTGAKPIYTQGVRFAYWQAGATVVFVYSGSSWRVASEPVYANTVTVGNASGRNVHIDDDSVDIRNGTTELATFTPDKIEIGKNSVSSRIDLCKGAGYIVGTKESTGLTLTIGTDGGPSDEGLYNGGMELHMAYYGYIGAKNLTIEANNSLHLYGDDMEEDNPSHIHMGGSYLELEGSPITANGQNVLAGGIVLDVRKENITVANTNTNTVFSAYTVPEDGIYLVTGGAQYKGTHPAGRTDVYVQYITPAGVETGLSCATFPYSQDYPCISWCGMTQAVKGSTIRTLMWNGINNCTILWERTTIMRLA